MKQITFKGLLCLGLTITILIKDISRVECKTIRVNSSQESLGMDKYRKLDNFVDFTEEGDQLAVESIGTVALTEGSEKSVEKSPLSTTSRQCPNVQKAVYPVIPVIIAALIGLIGSIIISAIVRLVFRIKNDSDDSSEFGGYDRRMSNQYTGLPFGLDFNKFSRIAKTVLFAIEKIY